MSILFWIVLSGPYDTNLSGIDSLSKTLYMCMKTVHHCKYMFHHSDKESLHNYPRLQFLTGNRETSLLQFFRFMI